MNYPSVKTLRTIAGDRAKELRGIIDCTTDSATLAERFDPETPLPIGGNPDSDDAFRLECAAQILADQVGAYGTACINGESFRGYWGEAVAAYVNRGDTYDTTLLLDVRSGRWYVTSWGDWVESYERRNGRLP